jgi:predicted TIM-barrel fold metal-dependent hydrolase
MRTNILLPTNTTRRDFLQTAALGTGALLMHSSTTQDAVAADEEKPLKKGFIDAHSHIWTPDTKGYPLGKGFLKKNMKPASFTPEQLFSHAKPVGVTRVVLIQMSFYRYDNSYMLDMMKKHPGRFSGVAVIDENDSPQKTMQAMKAKGVRGFRIRPGDKSSDEWLKTDGMQAMWKTGAKEGLAMCHLIDAKFLPSVGAMCKKYPYTPVVIDHFARIGVDGTVHKKELDDLVALAKHKTVKVKVSAYYALGKKAAPYTDLLPMIRRLTDAYGPERLMWASDCPFQIVGGHDYRNSIDLIRKRADFLSESDRDWILRRTAAETFFA